MKLVIKERKINEANIRALAEAKQFKNWHHLLKEQQELLTKEQNIGLKKIYAYLVKILLDLKKKLIENNISNNYDFMQFLKKYTPEDSSIKKGPKYILIPVPPEMQKTFSNLQDEFKIDFNAGEPDEAGLSEIDGKIIGLEILWKTLKEKDEMELKGTIQHELQHIIDKGGSGDDSIENPYLKYFLYVANSGEVKAHAKQYAYIYHKLFPNDVSVDWNKVETEMLPILKEKKMENFWKKLSYYIRILKDPKEIQTKISATDEQMNTIVKSTNDFKTAFIDYLKYYKEK